MAYLRRVLKIGTFFGGLLLAGTAVLLLAGEEPTQVGSYLRLIVYVMLAVGVAANVIGLFLKPSDSEQQKRDHERP